MSLTNEQYQEIMRMYEANRLSGYNLSRERKREVYAQIPQMRDLDREMAHNAVLLGKQLIASKDHNSMDICRQKNQKLADQKRRLLLDHGFPEDYLDPVYTCPDCKDTGYIGNQKCHCFKKAIIDLLYEQSNLKEILKKENFSNFALDYYSTNFIDPKTGRSSRQVIEDALRICRNFVTSFGTDFQNLFLYGDVGVGKTFLSNCIAKELMDKEYSVLYFSASKFFSSLAKHAFDKQDVDAQNMFELIYNCDCLIIDDLGTEYTNNFIASQFFTCINERLLNSRSTIISTNLSLDTLADLYTERSFSRITSNYIMLKLIGDDIRIKKKLKNREEN